jgi:ABC-2 type transport system ATP-binding protein
LSSSDAVIAEDLTKKYPGEVLALDHATFKVRRGEIFGLLGLNGAGKSTTIKILSTLVPPTSGDASILGFDILKDGIEIRKRIGVVQQLESYDRNLTVRASLSLYGNLWDVKRSEIPSAIESLVKKFGLQDVLDRKIRWLSYGQRRRLQVAREFLHKSDLLIVDEPTAGMDILARHSFLEYCRESAKDQGKTIFYTTHIISEAEYICDTVAIIHHGRIIALDSPKNLKKKYANVHGVSIILRNNDEVSRLSKNLDGFPLVQKKEETPDSPGIRVVTHDPFAFVTEFAKLVQSEGFEVESLTISEPSLEDVIVQLIGKEEEDQNQTEEERRAQSVSVNLRR